MEQRSQAERRHTRKSVPKSPFFMLIRKSERCLGLGRREQRASKASEEVRNEHRLPARGLRGCAHVALIPVCQIPLNQGNMVPSLTLIMAQFSARTNLPHTTVKPLSSLSEKKKDAFLPGTGLQCVLFRRRMELTERMRQRCDGPYAIFIGVSRRGRG